MVPEGWTCFPGSVKPARIHMLVTEQELTLNQPKLCQQKLRATIICPIDRWVVYLGAGGLGKGKRLSGGGEEPELTSVARVSTVH